MDHFLGRWVLLDLASLDCHRSKLSNDWTGRLVARCASLRQKAHRRFGTVGLISTERWSSRCREIVSAQTDDLRFSVGPDLRDNPFPSRQFANDLAGQFRDLINL